MLIKCSLEKLSDWIVKDILEILEQIHKLILFPAYKIILFEYTVHVDVYMLQCFTHTVPLQLNI